MRVVGEQVSAAFAAAPRRFDIIAPPPAAPPAESTPARGAQGGVDTGDADAYGGGDGEYHNLDKKEEWPAAAGAGRGGAAPPRVGAGGAAGRCRWTARGDVAAHLRSQVDEAARRRDAGGRPTAEDEYLREMRRVRGLAEDDGGGAARPSARGKADRPTNSREEREGREAAVAAALLRAAEEAAARARRAAAAREEACLRVAHSRDRQGLRRDEAATRRVVAAGGPPAYAHHPAE
eukprot:gene16015-25231_t